MGNTGKFPSLSDTMIERVIEKRLDRIKRQQAAPASNLKVTILATVLAGAILGFGGILWNWGSSKVEEIDALDERLDHIEYHLEHNDPEFEPGGDH